MQRTILTHSGQRLNPPQDLEEHLRRLVSASAGRLAQQFHAGGTRMTVYRNREMAWLRFHVADLASHRGKWVVLEGEEILASEAEYQAARRQATLAGISRPLIFFVPNDANPFMGV